MGAVILSIVLILTTTVLWSLSWLSHRKLPPGPWPWPIIGNLVDVKRGGFDPLAKKYGPIFTVWLGPRPLVIIAGHEEIREALINSPGVFSNRCNIYSMSFLSCNYKTVNTASGPLWRKLRRNLMFEVLNSTRLKYYKPVRDFEFRNLVKRIKDEARANDGVVAVLPLVRRTLFNVLITMCFGERMEESVVREVDDIMLERFNNVRPNLADYFPVLRFFDRRRVRAVTAVQARTNSLLMPYVERGREALQKGEPVLGRYLETLLEMQARSDGKEGQMTDENVLSLCTEIVNAGADVTSYTIEWTLALIINHMHVQRKLIDEMETVLGNRTIEESDVENLPYLQAVLKEVMRLHSPSSFSLPYAVSHPVKIGGYEIPTNAWTMFMVKAVGMEPKIWGDPENFRPERFLEEKKDVEFTGSRKLALIPFGVGKRICPGMNLALLNLHMIVGLLVQTFDWSNSASGEVDLTPTVKNVVILKSPLRARIVERKSETCVTAGRESKQVSGN